MAGIFTFDGVTYDVLVPTDGLTRSGSILDGENAGRLQSGSMELDTVGTYVNYKISIRRNNANVADYDAIYTAALDPTNRIHTVVMPYGQSTISFTCYISNAEDKLHKMRNGVNYWDGLELQVTMIDPYWTP